ncbi:MAG: mannose-6-phosphate isomerase, class I [Rhodoglobus sp.]
MFVGITNTPRAYAWGATGAISELLGWPHSDAIEAELWLGAHPGSPSRILDPEQVGGYPDLAAWIAADPGTALGERMPQLPFLLKVLAAASPLSLQAHPTIAQARTGFARENALGIPVDAANRNYRDENHKPELIYALSEEFTALCGFRSVPEILGSLGRLNALASERGAHRGALRRLEDQLGAPESLRPAFEWLISRGEGVDELIARVSELADDSTPELATAALLARLFPGDPGIVISLMLNTVTMKRGEVLYLPAGNIHAYLEGVGIELMSASDNVLRGGLTPKHVDVPELVDVLDFSPIPLPYLAPQHPSAGVAVFQPPVSDFTLVRVEDDGTVPLAGPAIVLCTAGDLQLAGGVTHARIERGEALYVTPDERTITFTGAGEAFAATVPARP